MNIKELIDSHYGNSIKFTKEELELIISTVNSRTQLHDTSIKAYKQCLRNGLIEKYFPVVKHTVEGCTELAKKYKTRTEFCRKEPGAYKFACKNNIIEKLFPETRPIINDELETTRIVYCYEDYDNKVVYIGFSKNVEKRHIFNRNIINHKKEHKYTPIKEYFIKQGKDLPMYIILESNLNLYNAQKKSYEWFQNYKENGWTVLNEKQYKNGPNISRIGKFWTEEKLREVARQCKNKNEMIHKFPGAYNAAKRIGINNELFEDRINEETIKNVASKCKNYTQFKNARKPYYRKAEELGMLEDLFPEHFKRTKPGYWKIKENVIQAANKCKTIFEFRTNYTSAYYNALHEGYIRELFPSNKRFPGMIYDKDEIEKLLLTYKNKTEASLKLPIPIYKQAKEDGLVEKCFPEFNPSIEECFEMAKQYSNKSDLRSKCLKLYKKVKEIGILDELYVDTLFDKDSKIRCIYSYEDIINHAVYVGLTKNIKNRHKQHNNKDYKYKKYDTVKTWFLEHNQELPMYKILEDGLNAEEAQEAEDKWIKKYYNSGWDIINKAKTGKNTSSVGSSFIYTPEIVEDLAKSCKTRSEFGKKYNRAAQLARKWGIMDKIFKKEEKWTEEFVRKIASECSDINYFRKHHPVAYNKIKELGLIDFYFPGHSDRIYKKGYKIQNMKSKNYWTKERIIEASKLCKNKTEFNKNYNTAYKKALKDGYLDELFPKKEKIINVDELRNWVSQFKTRTEANHGGSYQKFKLALDLGIIDEILPKKRRWN